MFTHVIETMHSCIINIIINIFSTRIDAAKEANRVSLGFYVNENDTTASDISGTCATGAIFEDTSMIGFYKLSVTEKEKELI